MGKVSVTATPIPNPNLVGQVRLDLALLLPEVHERRAHLVRVRVRVRVGF